MKRLENLSETLKEGNSKIVYSVPIGPKKKGETAIYRHPDQKDGLKKIPSELKSLIDLWDQSLKKYGQSRVLQNYNFIQVDKMMKNVGSWIKSHGHKLFFLYSLNCVEWTLTDIASWNFGLINVPLYDTLGQQAFDHILKITQGTLIFTTKNLIPNLQKFLSKNKRFIKQVCFFNQITKEEKLSVEKLGVKVSDFKEAMNYHRNFAKPKNLTLDTQITYSFTSGTTGIPKGVIYTHGMVIHQCYSLVGIYQLSSKDVHLSYLPIPHSFERFNIFACIFYGANIQYAKHPVSELMKDFAIVKPTTLALVPRLLNKFYPVLKALGERQGNFNKAKAIFGGRLRMIVSGSAPASPNILLFFADALGFDVREGYGQTESLAASFVTAAADRNYGHVGGPNRVTEFKLVDVPEMNYLTDRECPQGQICMRGPSVFSKYFKDPKNTAQTVDSEGWNHTGDIGRILPNGALKIIDRKKNIYKLQQGEYIAPEKVESVYARNKFVAESFLYGDSNKEYNIAIIHPNLDALPVLATNLGIKQTNIKKLCQNPKIIQYIHQQVLKQGKDDGLMGFEQAKKIILWHQPFAQVGIVTSTMKLQRHIAKDKFASQIQKLYQ